MAEYWYYYEWNDETDLPKKAFVLEKKMSDSDPFELFSEEMDQNVPVKRWINAAPAFINNNDKDHQFESKYKSFHDKQREGRAARGHVPLKDIVEGAGLTYEHTSVDPNTGKEVVQQKPITDTVVPTEQWNRMPKDKRKLAESLGILSQNHFISPGQVTPRNHGKLSKWTEDQHGDGCLENDSNSEFPSFSPKETTLIDKDGKEKTVTYMEF